MPWDPKQYHKFQSERSAPFYDLLKLVKIRPGLRAVDLGCGTGELTRALAEHLPDSNIAGIDTSPEMLAKADSFASPRLCFERRAIEELAGEWDLVFSNAAIHWVEDHAKLIPKLLAHVKPGGQLVAQLPSNFSHPSHTYILEIAHSSPFREALNHWTRTPPVLTIEQYANLLYQHDTEEITVFEKIYPHVLENADAIADWTSGTALVPYFERLPGALKEPFMQCYRSKLRQRFPESPIFYPFRRILFAATRRAAL